MLIVGQTLVSEDLAEKDFCCPLQLCSGACCVEGDAGAPLEAGEITLIGECMDQIIPYLSPEGKETIEKEGFYTSDVFGALVTQLIRKKECAFTVFEKGIAFCAIEKAWMEGKLRFRKPLSCHLYPVRVQNYDGFEAVNVHRWSVCEAGWSEKYHGSTPLYKTLKEALIRKFGEAWYEELEATAIAWRGRKL